MDKVLADNGVRLHFGEMVQEIRGPDRVRVLVTSKGEYPVDMVILAIGFKPNSALGAKDIEVFANGAYKVNLKQETSKPGVYAIGDCATVYSNATQGSAYIALATNAVRSGIVAGHNACGTALESAGVQGSNGICIFDYKMVSTGLNMAAAEKAGFSPVYTQFEDTQKPAFVKGANHKVKLRIVYDKKTRRILGAQMASHQDISMGIHMFSLAIEEKLTIDKLKLLDIFFLPHFNQPYNYITMAALSAK
jgi:NADPH-dependent 2,4-dienoyl-CoA reductase/sulfur reductase-like enzyme